jgi:hypothetical protein
MLAVAGIVVLVVRSGGLRWGTHMARKAVQAECLYCPRPWRSMIASAAVLAIWMWATGYYASWAAWLGLAVTSPILAAIGVRSFAVGLYDDGANLVVRNMLRTFSVPWAEVADVTPPPGNPGPVFLVRTNGSRLPVTTFPAFWTRNRHGLHDEIERRRNSSRLD